MSSLCRVGRWQVLFVLLLPVVVYLNSLSNPFQYDDFHSIADNPHIRTLANIPAFFSEPTLFSERPESAMYRPLLLSTFALNYAISGRKTWSYHLINMVWGYPFNRSYHMFSAWRILALASTTRARLASFKPGFEPMRTAWTTSNGCGGPTASSVRVAATKAVGAWAMAASCVRRVRHAVR